MKKTLLLAIMTVFFFSAQAQTVEEYKAQKADKEAQIKALQGEVDGLASKIASFPGWKFGALGTIGANFSSYNKWNSRDNANSFAGVVGLTANAFANLDQEKYLWRNGANLNLGWNKLDNNTDDDFDTDYEQVNDAFAISSLFGYKLNDQIAISALGEYRTTFLSNFNSPGYLDIGVGATWTPITDLVVVFHPLNYNIVFSDSDLAYESSLGCKIVADYTKQLPMGLAWKSNLSAFLSYGDISNLSNWTWINGVSANLWRGLGVGFELGLRGNKQEGYNAFLQAEEISSDDFKIDDLDSGDNPIQSYWILGLTYTL